MIQLLSKFKNQSVKTQAILALFSIALYYISSQILSASYTASQFPVPYFEQQTSFDASQMKTWYSSMIEGNTFDIYIQTQLIDFVFIASVIFMGFAVWLFIAQIHRTGSFFNRWGKKLAFALPLAGLFDVLENLVSFVMIANPLSFSDILVIPYSLFASIKFALWTIAFLGLILSIITFCIRRIPLGKLVKITGILLVFISSQLAAQEKTSKHLIYFEADPLAYINKGYSVHVGYENWGMRFDLTRVKVDFPENFEEAFYNTKAFDLVANISGIKIDYIGKRTNWTKGAFVGLDINVQRLTFTHRATNNATDLSTFNIGLRAGYKINIYKGFYITPWAAVWKNVSMDQDFVVQEDRISTNEWDWITTFHLGYAYRF